MIALIKLLVHFFGKIFFRPYLWLNSRRLHWPAGSPRKILYITLAYRGDLVLNFPALKAIRGKYPEAEITCWAREYNRSLAEMCESIDRVIFYDDFRFQRADIFKELNPRKRHREFFESIKEAKYDISIDDSGMAFSTLVAAYAGIPLRIGRNTQGFGFLNHHEMPYDFDAHLVKKRFALLKPLGIEMPDENELVPRIQVEDNIRKMLLGKLGLAAIQPGYFTIQPYAGWEAKNWDDHKFIEVVTEFSGLSGLQPVFIGGPKDKAALEGLIAGLKFSVKNLAGALELSETALLISGAAIHIGVDSIGSHLAAATGVKSLTLFGPTNPGLIAILTDKNIAVQKKTACTPAPDKIYCCKDAGRSCKNVVCMKALGEDVVLEILTRLWRGDNIEKITVC